MKYVRKIESDYCVLDLETTGLSYEYDEIIEIGILKVRNNIIVDKYQQLINPNTEIDEFITKLTGITNEMLKNMPFINDVKKEVLNFIGNDLIIGHNFFFDKNFIEFNFGEELPNEFSDTMQLSRKLFPDIKHHRLKDMVAEFNLSNNEHRSISDCISTKELYDVIKKTIIDRGTSISELYKHKRINISEITPESNDFDETSYFYQKHCIFTGALEKMLRKEAMQLVVNCGGIIDKNVTKQTNFLILGNNDYCSSIKDGKSKKQKKAEELKLRGLDIEILDENVFYKMLGVDKND